MTKAPTAAILPGFPELPPGNNPMIDFNLVPGTRGDGEVVDLLATCRVGPAAARDYGGGLHKAAFVAAIDKATGQVYIADASTPHSTPLNMQLLAERPPPKPEDPAIVCREGSFAIDLARQLGLPAQGGEFNVVIWIDDLVSKVKSIAVPANPALRPAKAPMPWPADLSPISLGVKPRTPKATERTINLVEAPEEQPFGIGHLYGRAGENAVPRTVEKPWLTAFCSVWFTREAVGTSIALPGTPSPAEGFAFDFEAGALFSLGVDRRRSFAFVVAGMSVSPVVTLNPKR
jgi:hypothetical protein